MFFIKETVTPNHGNRNDYEHFFHEFILPNKIKNGAKLVGRWVKDDSPEILTVWQYPSYEEYLKIEQRVIKDKMYEQAQSQLMKKGPFLIESRIEFLTSTGAYEQPRHAVSVSGYITNEKNEVLLVKTYWRADTWELPGGGVDEGETLDVALRREILEETGIEVKLEGVTGVYSNGQTVAIVFRGVAIGGKLMTSNETEAIRFIKINPENVTTYITRSKFIPRVLDAMEGLSVPYEAFKVRPYQLVERIKGHDDYRRSQN